MAKQKKLSLRDLSRGTITPEESEYFTNAMNAPSDLAAAILLAIKVEADLEESILLRLARRDDETIELLGKDNGALGTFFSKIGLAYALGVYNAKVMEYINVVRRIRNTFAHARRKVTFATLTVREELHALKLPKKDDSFYENIRIAKGLTSPKASDHIMGKADMDSHLGLSGRAAYTLLCFDVQRYLLTDHTTILRLKVGAARAARSKAKSDDLTPPASTP